MKTFGIISIVLGSISALGALTAGHNPAGPIFWIILGIVLGAGEIFTDRVIHKVPSMLAVVLLVAALILIIIGIVIARRAGA